MLELFPNLHGGLVFLIAYNDPFLMLADLTQLLQNSMFRTLLYMLDSSYIWFSVDKGAWPSTISDSDFKHDGNTTPRSLSRSDCLSVSPDDVCSAAREIRK